MGLLLTVLTRIATFLLQLLVPPCRLRFAFLLRYVAPPTVPPSLSVSMARSLVPMLIHLLVQVGVSPLQLQPLTSSLTFVVQWLRRRLLPFTWEQAAPPTTLQNSPPSLLLCVGCTSSLALAMSKSSSTRPTQPTSGADCSVLPRILPSSSPLAPRI